MSRCWAFCPHCSRWYYCEGSVDPSTSTCPVCLATPDHVAFERPASPDAPSYEMIALSESTRRVMSNHHIQGAGPEAPSDEEPSGRGSPAAAGEAAGDLATSGGKP